MFFLFFITRLLRNKSYVVAFPNITIQIERLFANGSEGESL